ncbi:hypothetical protein QCA50_019812 [Cerrena zonata]|uniref:DUF6532 domain-containing protein n=1 Tax=Cerrena zonata TaxID=2478898 RepID=A0AAW0FA06_9APHY
MTRPRKSSTVQQQTYLDRLRSGSTSGSRSSKNQTAQVATAEDTEVQAETTSGNKTRKSARVAAKTAVSATVEPKPTSNTGRRKRGNSNMSATQETAGKRHHQGPDVARDVPASQPEPTSTSTAAKPKRGQGRKPQKKTHQPPSIVRSDEEDDAVLDAIRQREKDKKKHASNVDEELQTSGSEKSMSGDVESDFFESDGELRMELSTEPKGKMAKRLTSERAKVLSNSGDEAEKHPQVQHSRDVDTMSQSHGTRHTSGAKQSDGSKTSSLRHLPDSHFKAPKQAPIILSSSDDELTPQDSRFSFPNTKREHSDPPITVKTELPAKWPQWTEFIAPAPGGKLAKKLQPPQINNVLDTAIELAHLTVIFKHPFSPIHLKDQDLLQCLIDAAKQHKYTEIEDRLKVDKPYARSLARVPDNRFGSLRGKFKTTAATVVSSMYQLNTGNREECKARVRLLCQRSPQYPLICPPISSTNLNADLNRPFLHPIIIHILRNTPTLSAGDKSIVKRMPHIFKEEDGVYRVPPNLVALAATAACAALLEWSDGIHKATEFNSAYSKIFDEQIETLDDLREEHAALFPNLMEFIWKEAYGDMTETGGNRERRKATVRIVLP